MTLFGALLGVLGGALTAVPLAATIQIFVHVLTTARREQIAAAKAALEPTDASDGVILTAPPAGRAFSRHTPAATSIATSSRRKPKASADS